MDKQQSPDDRQPPAAERKPYVRPELVFYGDVRLLTRNASGSIWETANPGGNCTGTSNNGKQTGPYCASDAAAKQNLVRVGTHPWGFGLYLYQYRPEYRAVLGDGRQFGVIAQEVERVCPDAVAIGALGLKAVNYELLGIRRSVH